MKHAVIALGAALAISIPVAADQADAFGAPLTLKEPTPLAKLVAEPERFAETPVLIRGKLTDVCQRKGCWTVIQDGSARVRVRFEDYGFFLPKDSTGRRALAQGLVTVRTLSAKEARHYESESRDGDPDAVEGPRREIGFTASGVRLLPRQP